VCFGAAVSASRRFPTGFGWIAVAGGGGSATGALFQIFNGGEVQAAETVVVAASLLIALCAFALGVMMWRADETAAPVALSAAVASD